MWARPIIASQAVFTSTPPLTYSSSPSPRFHWHATANWRSVVAVVSVSFKMRQVVQMVRTSIVRTKSVRCVLISEMPKDLDAIGEFLETCKLHPRVDKAFPLEQADEAHRYADSEARSGASSSRSHSDATARWSADPTRRRGLQCPFPGSAKSGARTPDL